MFTFKKIASVLASAVMLSSTIGFAAAASFPDPFVVGGAEDAAIVVGLNADVSDVYAAIDVQDNLNALTSGGGTSTSISGTAWQVATSADKLELNETLRQVTTYINEDDLPILVGGTISNEKGTAKYDEYLYFEDTTAGSSSVTYREDDDENVGLFFRIASGNVIARYVMDFTTNFDSDISTNTLEDIDDEEITIMGKTYTITKAENATSGAQLTLMSGAEKVTVSNGEEVTAAGKTISVVVSSATQAQFTIDGETTNKLNDGDTYKLSDGTYIGISDITYQGFSGGLMQSTIYVGADKIELFNGSSMTVNAETISDADVRVVSSISGGDISISEISVNMTAEDDLYVPIDAKLSEADDLDEPEVLIGQNWDIEFKGLDTAEYEEMSVKKSTDSKIKLAFRNYNDDDIDFPLIWANSSYLGGGDGFRSKKLILDANQGNISKNYYFILNTADPFTVSNDARSFVVQYKGSDDLDGSNSKAKFNVVGIDSAREVTLNPDGSSVVRLAGLSFYFSNTTTCHSSDCKIRLVGGNTIANSPITMRTYENAKIVITPSSDSITVDVSETNHSEDSFHAELTLEIDNDIDVSFT